jgi:hypothetical protein
VPPGFSLARIVRILLLYAATSEARQLSYQGGWPKHFVRDARFDCVPLNVRSRWARPPRQRFEAVVVLHSVFSNACYLTGRLFDRIAALPQPKAYFVGNEYKLMPEKIAFCEGLGVSLVVSQLSSPAAHQLYRDRLGCEVAAIPSAALDPEVFVPRTPAADRSIDLGYRAYDSPVYLGHSERRELAERFREAAQRRGLRADISTAGADRFDEAGWASFLDRCRGQLGSEAGADFFELTDETRNRVNAWCEANPGSLRGEILSRFFADPPTGPSGRALSGRVVEAAGTKTVQLLLEGEYGGYFRPDDHYVPVRKDFADLDDALDKLADEATTAGMVERAREVALAELTYERLLGRFHDALAALL